MTHIDPILLLAGNGSLQILASCLLGAFMLLPMQPWGCALLPNADLKSLRSTHVDWLMLAFMQFGAAFIFARWPAVAARETAWMLVFGGWINPLPFLLRGFGIDAFVFGGPPLQRSAASVSGLSAVAIIGAWALILLRLSQLGW
jgi:hypothetical protein